MTTSINILASTSMIYSETLTSLDTILICIIKNISRGTFRPTKKHAAGTGGTFSTLSVVTYLRIWRGCSLLMDTRLGLKASFTVPPGSTVGLSHSERATWLQHTQTALELMRTWKYLLGVFTKTVINSVLLFCVFGTILMTSIKSPARIAYFWA